MWSLPSVTGLRDDWTRQRGPADDRHCLARDVRWISEEWHPFGRSDDPRPLMRLRVPSYCGFGASVYSMIWYGLRTWRVTLYLGPSRSWVGQRVELTEAGLAERRARFRGRAGLRPAPNGSDATA